MTVLPNLITQQLKNVFTECTDAIYGLFYIL